MRTNGFRSPIGLLALALAALPATASSQDVIGRDGRQKVKLEWDKLDSKNYAMMYERGLDKSIAQRVSDELEDILVQYKKLFPAKQKERFLVQLLDSQDAYQQVGGDYRHPGFYSPSNRTLVLLNRPFYDLIPTVYHEAFHQYLDFYVGYDAKIPTWFNEGMAMYYEGMQRDDQKKGKPLNPKKIDVKKIRMVQSAMRTRTSIPLTKLIDATYEEFHEKETEGLHYNSSFALVYYFMETTKGRGPKSYMKEMQKSKDPAKARGKLFGKFAKDEKSLKKLESHWKAWTQKIQTRDNK